MSEVFNELLNKIKNNEFVKNVITLLSGTAVGQIFSFLIIPVLTRMYSEELFGIYFIFLSTLNILKKVSTLRFELAILLPKKNSWAINAFAITIIFSVVTSVIILLGFYLLENLISKIKDISEISRYFILMPIALFASGIYEAFAAWNNRQKKYKKISVGKITNSTGIGLAQLGLNFTSIKNAGLIVGSIIGQAISSVIIAILTIKDIAENFKYISFKKMKITLVKYKNIPTFNTTIDLFSSISNEIPVYLLTIFFNPTIAGYYGMSNKIIGTPMFLLSRSVGQVFFQKASENYIKKIDLKSFLKKTYKNLVKLCVFPTLGILVIAPFIHYILGKEWTELPPYILILLPATAIDMIINPVLSIPTILNKQKNLLYLIIISAVLKTLSIAMGFYIFNSPIISIALFSITTTLFRLFLMKWLVKISPEEYS